MPPARIFISYSRKDANLKDELLTHLGTLQREGLVMPWHDMDIAPGEDWGPDIDTAMAQADIAIFLITSNFLTSSFILDNEVPLLMERRNKEGLIIYPIIAKPCAWKDISWLSKISVRPQNGTPVWGDGGRHVDEDLATITAEIAVIARRLQMKGGLHR